MIVGSMILVRTSMTAAALLTLIDEGSEILMGRMAVALGAARAIPNTRLKRAKASSRDSVLLTPSTTLIDLQRILLVRL